MYLNEVIYIDNKIARSVNLERDISNLDQIRQFQITRMAHKVLKGFIEALEGEPETAWSITGPYGTGKSSFCNFLFALCGSSYSKMKKAAFENFEQRDTTLLKRFVAAKKKVFFICGPYHGMSR